MPYTKTQWVDNDTDIDKDNLNKIEQGIYDNSLVVDAITNTLNPTDTETYKTAELTEGQITDVIGVNDIVIKGQTLQDGEPTPSSPVDVNVVSGSNVINTSNKNLFNKDTKDFSKGYFLDNNGVEQPSANWGVYYIRVEPNEVYSISGCQSNGGVSFCWFNKNKTFISYIGSKQNRNNMTAPNNAYFLGLSIVWNITSSAYDNNIMLEKSSTATTYEPHQGKELPLDLPVENLFNPTLNSQTLSSGTVITKNSDNSYTMSKGSSTADLIILGTINVKEGEIYYLSDQRVGGANNISLRRGGSVLVTTETNSIVEYTSTATETLNVYARYQSTSDLIYKPMISTKYSKTYTPYGTDPIELCKIGNYQDYFYKSGSKWYLHKEIGKVVLDESGSWYYSPENVVFYSDIIRTLAKVATEFICDYFKKISNSINYSDMNNGEIKYDGSTSGRLILKYTTFNNIDDFKTWLASNNVLLYYILETATDTEITDTTLISQLEAIYNAPLYEQTNITQTNNDLPMVLDITACKDNINGIKAFIRK